MLSGGENDDADNRKRDAYDDTGVFRSREGFVSGTPVFEGTRVPLKNLFDYLAVGPGLDAFLHDFPGVGREQAIRTIDMAREVLESVAYEAAAR